MRCNFKARHASLWAMGMVTLMTAGCRILPAPKADPARFYTLGGTAMEAPAAVAATGWRIGLRPVELPSYLQNRALVVRQGGNRIYYEQNDRWAEPLDEAIARVVRARLRSAPTVAAVWAAPFPIEEPRDLEVTVRVLRCEGASEADGGATAQFSATIEIVRVSNAGRAMVARKVFTTSLDWAATKTATRAHNLDMLAGQLGVAVEALGQAIAAALPTQP
jgi:uncharacterized lipoprotein YmbA